MIRFDLITIFPHMLDSYVAESMLARAKKKRLVKIVAHNLRDYATDKHKTVDDSPYGGGVGMVLKIEPIFKAVTALKKKQIAKNKKQKVILLSAKGKQFTQAMAKKYAKLDRIIFICGRYEGVDERVAKYIADEEISVGPYVLTGGELPAMVLIDAISRHIPGVLGNKNSLLEESFSIPSLNPKRYTLNAVREYPHYTRPAVFESKKGEKWSVPKVLLSGDHAKINAWRTKFRNL